MVWVFQPVQPEVFTASRESAARKRLSASAVPLITASTVQSTWPGHVRELADRAVSEVADSGYDVSEAEAMAAASPAPLAPDSSAAGCPAVASYRQLPSQ